MAKLIHEVWEEPDEDGRMLPGLCLAGPDGDGFRKLLAPGAQLVRTFEAGSRSEAMQFTCDLCGRGAYTTVHAVDHDPYPEDWARRQRGEN